MAISKGTTLGLAYTIVIIALILPPQTTAAQVVSIRGSVVEDNTIRVDPLDHFKKYRGGFDLTNSHYWTSVLFTGIYGYAIGVIWLLCGMMCGLFWIIINFCCQSQDGGRRTKKILPCNHKSCHFSPIPPAISFIILIMAASVVVYVGSANFHFQARTSVNVIMKIADDASEIVHNVTRVLDDVQKDLESSISIEGFTKLNATARRLNDVVDDVVKKTRKHRRTVNKAFKVVLIMTILIITLNLVAVPILSVFGVKMFWRPFYVLVILCWLMTVVCWLIFGLYFFLENFSYDTCTFLKNFEENPYNNSLTSTLPCGKLLSAKSILHKIAAEISHVVYEVNSNVGSLFPNGVYLCDPFSAPPEYLYQPENCQPNSIRIGDIPEVLKPYTCFSDNNEKCGSSEDFINVGEYKLVETYTGLIQNILNMYPTMEHLIECQLVKDAFSQIILKHCKPLKKFSRMTWIGVVFFAVVMVFFILLWTIKACQDHTHHPSDCSV